MDNFDLRQYLTENKATVVSRLLEESKEFNFNDPTTICNLEYLGDQVIGQGEGFNVAEIAKALAKGYELQVEERPKNITWSHPAYFDWRIHPDRNGTGCLEVSPDGKWTGAWKWEKDGKCDSFESGAAKFQKVLTSCTPKELNNHVKGWIVVHSPKFRHGIYPMLDPEGVKIYLAAEDRLGKDIDNFYKGSTYWGD